MATLTRERAPQSSPLDNRTHIPHVLDKGLGARLRVGLIVLATDQTTEHEARRVLALPGVDLYESRIWNDANITVETLSQMAADIEGTARLILPDVRLDTMGFACTSGALVIGEEKVFELIRRVRPGIPCSSPITGAIAGIKALGLKRVALLTPYVPAINELMRTYLEARGIAVPVVGSFSNPNDDEVARISTASTREAAIELGRSKHVDGVFVSCTSLRTIDIVREVEEATGKPMIASNPALSWHLLRLGKVEDKLPQWGRLFTV